MNTLNYKGYIGSVAFSEKDNVFFGKIEGINGLVNFEGESVKRWMIIWNIARRQAWNHTKVIPAR